VEEIGRAREAGPTVVGREPVDVGIVLQTERLERPGQLRFVGTAVDVDPQKSVLAERPDDLRGQLDLAIGRVRVEQSDGDVAQCSELSRTAAIAAMKATRYCSASMVRSWGGSTSHDPVCLVAGSISIDVRTS
jgi:hypothetical protein